MLIQIFKEHLWHEACSREDSIDIFMSFILVPNFIGEKNSHFFITVSFNCVLANSFGSCGFCCPYGCG